MDFQASDLPLSGADNHCVFWSKSLSIFQNCSQSHLPKSVLLFFSNKNIVLALFQRFTAFREHISIRQTNIPCQACLRISLGCSFNFPVLLLAFGARSHLPLCPSCLSTLLFPALTTVEGMGTIPQLPFHPCVMLQVPGFTWFTSPWRPLLYHWNKSCSVPVKVFPGPLEHWRSPGKYPVQ